MRRESGQRSQRDKNASPRNETHRTDINRCRQIVTLIFDQKNSANGIFDVCARPGYFCCTPPGEGSKQFLTRPTSILFVHIHRNQTSNFWCTYQRVSRCAARYRPESAHTMLSQRAPEAAIRDASGLSIRYPYDRLVL